jgi:nucleoside-diphosphate-sugar epimerase
MHIAILGGSSQIAKDLAKSLGVQGRHSLSIYARRPAVVRDWLHGSAGEHFSVAAFEEFAQTKIKFDAVINFVGAGNPARVMSMGADIYGITSEFDQLALDYITRNPGCQYIFASSGAVYGSDFSVPVNAASHAIVPINNLPPSGWYGIAKLYAECRHRALINYPIVDVRFFNYFSSTQDINDRFLVTDALRAAKDGVKFRTSPENIVRDYMGPQEVLALIGSILSAGPANMAIDGYTKHSVSKFQMLDALREKFGLMYEIDDGAMLLNATGSKNNYFSENRLAHDAFGYMPQRTALEVVLQEAEGLFV